MGSPQFAVDVAQKLRQQHNIIGVCTAPPRPAARGKKLVETPVHKWADENRIPILDIAGQLPKADAGVVASYGVFLKDSVINHFPMGCINVHPSLLPRWRGAAPIERAILAGDKTTGVCIMQITQQLDAGDIYAMREIPVAPRETTASLTKKLADIGGGLLLQVLQGNPRPTPQPGDGATYAEKIRKEEGLIDWNAKTADEIDRQIRAIPSWFMKGGQRIKVLEARPVPAEQPAAIIVKCKQGFLVVDVLQREGRNPLPAEEFIKGFRNAKI